MDPIAVPADLSELSDTDLEELSVALTNTPSRFAALSVEELSDEQIGELEQAADDLGRVDAELAARAAELAGRRERAEAAVARFSADPEAGDEPEVEAPEAPEAPDPSLALAAEEVVMEEEVVEPEADPEVEEEVVVASGRVVGRKLSQGLSSRRPAAVAPKVAPAPRGPFMIAEAHVNDLSGYRAGQGFSNPKSVAEAMTAKRLKFGVVPNGMREKLPIATGRKQLNFSVGGDAGSNIAMFAAVRDEHVRIVEQGFSDDALVASGGCCAPFTPLYEFFRTAEAATDVDDSLPTVQAERGGIRFIPATDWRDAAAGVGIYTCADGEEDPLVEKPCIHVVCPGVDDAETQAFTQCMSFDNLQYRVFPELVESFQSDMAVAFANRKEVAWIAAIDAVSTAVTAAETYGAVRTVLGSLTLAAVQYRHRNAMSVTATLPAYLEAWVRDSLATDILFDASNGVQELARAYELVDDGFAARNLQPIWWRNLDNAGGKIATAQGAGALNPWPTTVVARFHAPGSFVKLDGGTLDVGLVRDSSLNRTNDLELFMEEWLGLAFVGNEAIKLTIDLCVNGAAPRGQRAVCNDDIDDAS